MHFIILKMIATVTASECTQFVFGWGSRTLAGLWGTLLLRGREEEGRVGHANSWTRPGYRQQV